MCWAGIDFMDQLLQQIIHFGSQKFESVLSLEKLYVISTVPCSPTPTYSFALIGSLEMNYCSYNRPSSWHRWRHWWHLQHERIPGQAHQPDSSLSASQILTSSMTSWVALALNIPRISFVQKFCAVNFSSWNVSDRIIVEGEWLLDDTNIWCHKKLKVLAFDRQCFITGLEWKHISWVLSSALV